MWEKGEREREREREREINVYTFLLHSSLKVVDMRWGVRDEMTDEHMTTALCMNELRGIVSKTLCTNKLRGTVMSTLGNINKVVKWRTNKRLQRRTHDYRERGERILIQKYNIQNVLGNNLYITKCSPELLVHDWIKY